MERRDFLKKSSGAALSGAILSPSMLKGFNPLASPSAPLYKISLAQWTLNRKFFKKEIDNLDFASIAKNELGIDAVEYVNQFFMKKAKDMDYLNEMKMRAEDNGVTNVLIMCDGEGAIGSPDKATRVEAAENHHKWADAAKFLGCHSIRVNAFSGGTWGAAPDAYTESQKLVADGLSHLLEYVASMDLNLIVENHGGNSSNADWLAGVMEIIGSDRMGTLPDFGNFTIYKDLVYDPYVGVDKLMPFAKGVSVKPSSQKPGGGKNMIDYEKMMRIVLKHGFRGYAGIETVGPKGEEYAAIKETRDQLIAVREALASEFE